MTATREPILPVQLTIVPAHQASWADLQLIVGTARFSGDCYCQRFKVRDRYWKSMTDQDRQTRLREQTHCDNPRASTTSGLVAYLGPDPASSDPPGSIPASPGPASSGPASPNPPGSGPASPGPAGQVAVGWVAVEPRTAYPRLLGVRTVWSGREEDKADDGVWAVPCFVTRQGYRKRGITYALAAATVEYARKNGARALEGYPMLTAPGQEVPWGELHIGSRQVFAAAGFAEVSHPSPHRVVMRIDFAA